MSREELCPGEPGPTAWGCCCHCPGMAGTQHGKGCSSHIWRAVAPGRCFVREIFPWESTCLAWLCDAGCSEGVRLFPGAQGCGETPLRAAVQHRGLLLPSNWIHLTKGCSWWSQGSREATAPDGTGIGVSPSCNLCFSSAAGCWGEERQKAPPLSRGKCCSHYV